MARHIRKQLLLARVDEEPPPGGVTDIAFLALGAAEGRSRRFRYGRTQRSANIFTAMTIQPESARNPSRCSKAVDFMRNAVSTSSRASTSPEAP